MLCERCHVRDAGFGFLMCVTCERERAEHELANYKPRRFSWVGYWATELYGRAPRTAAEWTVLLRTMGEEPAMRKPRLYLVSTEPYDGSYSMDEPPEPTCDYAVVRCTTKKRARVLAVRYWRHENSRTRSWRKQNQSVTWGENPFKGLTVEDITDRLQDDGGES